MYLRRILALWAPLMAAHVSAQDPSASVSLNSVLSPSSTTSATQQTHTITVGKAAHKFTPDSITAEIGDLIIFQFFPPNHSVVKAIDIESPCVPYELSGRNKVGFFSGFYPLDVIPENSPEFKLTLNDTIPIYYYCSAIGSCIDWEMVGVINPKNEGDLQHHKELAKNASYMLQPWESFPAEASSTLSSSSPTATTTSSSSTSQAPLSQTTTATAAPEKHGGLSTGTTIGIAVGSAAVALILAALFFFMWRSRRLAKKVKYGSVGHNNSQQPSGGQSDPTKGAPIVDGDTIYVPVKRVDYRNSGATSGYGEAPPYDNVTIRTDDLNTPYSRTTSPGLPTAHQHYGPPNRGHPERYSDMTGISEAYAPYTAAYTKPDFGPHEMATPEMMERHTNNDRQ